MMTCDHSVPPNFDIGGINKKIGTLTDKDLNFLALQSCPTGNEATVDNIADWICKNEDIRIVNMILKRETEKKV